MKILKLKDITKKFDKQEVLKRINLEINTPGIYALIGPNGCGKTTLFNIISNLIKPTSGSVEVLGKSNNNINIFYEVSFLRDQSFLYSYLTGYDHLNFIALTQKIPKKRILEVIDKMGISDYINKKISDCSLGMKQKILIAMAILNSPKLMILDEPLNGLDPSNVLVVRKILKEFRERGTTIFLSSHILSEIELLADKVMFLKDGVIISDNSLRMCRFQIDSNDFNKINLLKKEYSILQNVSLMMDVSQEEAEFWEKKFNEFDICYRIVQKSNISIDEKYQNIFNNN